jgi:hypothetical protein
MTAEPKSSGLESSRTLERDIESDLRQLIAELDHEPQGPTTDPVEVRFTTIATGNSKPSAVDALRQALHEAIEKTGFRADEPDLTVRGYPATLVIAFRGVVVARVDRSRLLARADAIDAELRRKAS